MLKKLGLIALTSLALAAVAQDGPVAAAAGRAALANKEGRRANTTFEVVKFVKEGKEGVRGGLQFHQVPTPQFPNAVTINLPRAAGLGVIENRAEFGGEAVLVLMTKEGPKRIKGKANVVVVDKGRPGQLDLRDEFVIRFAAAEGELTYGFGGVVREGDIKVNKRKQ